MRIHEIKTRPKFFWPQVIGKKPFEVRRKDRFYQVGDIIRLQEWTPEDGFTGNAIDREITYILDDPEYCKKGYVILGLR